MTPKRIILTIMTLAMVFLVGTDLISSFSKPQFASRLELYETDLRLQISELKDDQSRQLQKMVRSQDPVKEALKQYQKTRDQAGKTFADQLSRVAVLRAKGVEELEPQVDELTQAVDKQQVAIDEMDLRIGVLQAAQNDAPAALKTWQPMVGKTNAIGQTATALTNLWGSPAKVADAAVLEKGLDSWFRDEALERQYQLSKNDTALAALEEREQAAAAKAVVKLGVTGGISIVSLITGIGVLAVVLGQRVLKGSESILTGVSGVRWQVPWDWEIVWQVLIVGFFFVGQVLLPMTLGSVQGALGLSAASLGERGRAFWILLSYLGLAGGGLAILYGSIKEYLPLAENWFQVDPQKPWFIWGWGGYFAAFPMVVGVSFVNQMIWQGHGGSNPILSIASQNQDPAALLLIFVTAAIAAPFYEETLFRGFLLPSLTRYMPTWGAIVLSSFLFAIVHLSLSEVLPLMALAIVLGVVYTRTQNLLASMLLHSLWNSGTLIALFLMGGQ